MSATTAAIHNLIGRLKGEGQAEQRARRFGRLGRRTKIDARSQCQHSDCTGGQPCDKGFFHREQFIGVGAHSGGNRRARR